MGIIWNDKYPWLSGCRRDIYIYQVQTSDRRYSIVYYRGLRGIMVATPRIHEEGSETEISGRLVVVGGRIETCETCETWKQSGFLIPFAAFPLLSYPFLFSFPLLSSDFRYSILVSFPFYPIVVVTSNDDKSLPPNTPNVDSAKDDFDWLTDCIDCRVVCVWCFDDGGGRSQIR